MDAELYSTMASALGVALILSLAFLGTSFAWIQVADKLQGRRPFVDQIAAEAGHRVRQQLKALDVRYYQFLGSLLVFILVFATAFVLEMRSDLFQEPGVQNTLGHCLNEVSKHAFIDGIGERSQNRCRFDLFRRRRSIWRSGRQGYEPVSQAQFQSPGRTHG